MYNLKLIITQLFLCMSTLVFAQEICDNAIDDDGDGLIDLNDDSCDCNNSIDLTDTTGFICRDNLRLILEDADAISYQWYQDGIAIVGETGSELLLAESPTVEGIYQVMVMKPDGCYLSVGYDLVIEIHEVYLGEETICEGDTVFFGGFALTFSGFFQNNGFAVDGCDSITTLNVVVEQPSFGYVNAQLCDGQTIEVNGFEFDTPGIEEIMLPSQAGCDSIVTINITEGTLEIKEIDAAICPGQSYEGYGITAEDEGSYETILDNPLGCDTMLTVHVSFIDQPTLTITEMLCPGASYDDNGINTDIPGTYDATLPNANGCDTLLTIELVEATQPVVELFETLCIGNIYDDNGIYATEAGLYNSVLPASEGCDTILTLDLKFEEEPTEFIEAFVCEGDTFIFRGMQFTDPGVTEVSYNYGGVCDSIITVDLQITDVFELNLEQTICAGEMFDQYGITTDVEGLHENILTHEDACDSIVTLLLTVAQPTESFLTDVICPGTFYDLYDIHADTSGTYQTVIKNINGCDSTINIELELLQEATEEIFYNICEGETFTYEGQSYTEQDVYINNYISASGCDSTLSINLTVEEQPTAFREVYICDGQTYEFGGTSEDQDGIYEYIVENPNSCDSIITVQLTVIEPGEGVDLEYYHTVVYGSTIDISPEFMGEGVTDITWMNEQGEEIGNGPTLEDFMTLTDMNIFLNGTDANGCPVEARAIIDVELEIDIFIPTVFTPDGDGDNDRFQLYGGPTVERIKELYIYNKWGELMHSAINVPATDEYIGWDGMFRGKPAIQGAYAYIAIFEIVTGAEKTVTGTVTLVY